MPYRMFESGPLAATGILWTGKVDDCSGVTLIVDSIGVATITPEYSADNSSYTTHNGGFQNGTPLFTGAITNPGVYFFPYVGGNPYMQFRVSSYTSGTVSIRVEPTNATIPWNGGVVSGFNATTVRVKDFGAVGDGVTDDTAAINRAFHYIRTRPLIATRQPYRLVFDPGVYRCLGSINGTGITSLDNEIDGDGATIVSEATGKVALDFLGSRWLRVFNLRVIGHSTNTPRIGIQIGRYNATAVDNNFFSNISLTGRFSLTGFYNFCSETTTFQHIYADNSYPSVTDCFAFVQDGKNSWTLASDFLTVTAAANTNGSFNENLFLNCDFRQQGAGSALWMAETARHRFVSCYAAVTSAKPAIRLYYGTTGHRSLDMDIHCETTVMTACVAFEGASTQVYDNFMFREHDVQASSAVFALGTGASFVSLLSGKIDLGNISGSTTKVFDNASAYIVSCDVNMYNRGIWNQPRSFSGMLTLKQSTIPVNLGSFRVQTADATATRLTKDGTAAAAGNTDALETGTIRHYNGRVIAYEPATGDTKSWTFEATIKRSSGGTTSLVGTPTVTALFNDTNAASWALAITADTTNNALAITGTGQAAKTIRWMASTHITEVF